MEEKLIDEKTQVVLNHFSHNGLHANYDEFEPIAAKEGFMFDSWDEFFDYDKWMSAFERTGVDTAFYNLRERDLEEIDQSVRKCLNFVTAQTVDTVLQTALNYKKEVL